MFVSALRDMTVWLGAGQVPHTAIGGIAVALIAQPRMTQDVDTLVWLEHDRWKDFLQAGERYGFTPRLSDALEFAVTARVLLLRHEPSGINFDVSLGALPFELEMIERAVTVKVSDFEVKVPTPEDLIITKAVARRPKDIVDIEAILSAHPHLDVQRVRFWVREFAVALERPQLSEDLEALLHRGAS